MALRKKEEDDQGSNIALIYSKVGCHRLATADR